MLEGIEKTDEAEAVVEVDAVPYEETLRVHDQDKETVILAGNRSGRLFRIDRRYLAKVVAHA